MGVRQYQQRRSVPARGTSIWRLAAFVAALSACAPAGGRVSPTGGAGGGGVVDGAPGSGGGIGSGGPANTGGGSGSDGGGSGAGAGGGPSALAIPSAEVATRLARVLWNEAPDAAFLKMVEAGAIKTSADVRQLALGMLTDTRARAGVGAFYRWWLKLDDLATMHAGADPITHESEELTKDQTLFPAWTAAMSADAAKETETFAVNVTLNLEGSLRTLMTAPFSYLNANLATLYGVSGVTGSDLRKVDLDPVQRGGLLTQPALQALTSHANRTSSHTNITLPPRRGKFIRDRFFCQTIALNTQIGVPPLPDSPNTSIRKRFEALTEDPGRYCSICHVLQQINALGFAFEGFDAIGRLRTLDDVNAPVDPSGQLKDDAGNVLTFDGPVQLAAHLAELSAVQRCMGQQWLTFAMGRPLTPDEDTSVSSVSSSFQSAGLDLRALIAATVSSQAFLAPSNDVIDGGATTDGDGQEDGRSGAMPDGCAQAANIFDQHSCATLCHSAANASIFGGFDMQTTGWEMRLLTGGPPDNALSNQCKGKMLHYLNATQPATGLFLSKLAPNPPCGTQMPQGMPALSASELSCVQKWANNLAAGGTGQ